MYNLSILIIFLFVFTQHRAIYWVVHWLELSRLFVYITDVKSKVYFIYFGWSNYRQTYKFQTLTSFVLYFIIILLAKAEIFE